MGTKMAGARRSPLDNPQIAAFAWRRFRRLMAGMAGVTSLVVVVVLVGFYRANGLVSVHFYIAVGIGMFAAMMLLAALMALVFLSNATGHDAAVGEAERDKSEDYPG